MKIEDQYAVNSTAARRASSSAHSAVTFQQSIAQATTQYDSQATPSSQKSSSTAPAKTAYEDLLEYMKKSPVEHWREKILQEMGLTEDQLAALPPEARGAVEKEIAERMQKQLRDPSA